MLHVNLFGYTFVQQVTETLKNKHGKFKTYGSSALNSAIS